MALKPHEERVLVEQAELNDRIKKLHDFIHSHNFDLLDPVDQKLLRKQYDIMIRYRMILEKRIERFSP